MTDKIDILSVTEDKSKLIDFSNLDQNSFIPAIEALISQLNKKVSEIIGSTEIATWDNVITPLDDAVENLTYVWSIISHLNSVVDTPELRAIYNELLPLISETFGKIGQNEALYKKYKDIKNSDFYKDYPDVRKRILEKEIQGFVLSGAELNNIDKEKLLKINQEQAQLAQKFSENLLDCTNNFALYLSEDTNDLDGITTSDREMFAQQARLDGKEGYKITLHMPNYLAIMQYASNRKLRENIYEAYSTRASNLGPLDKDNAPIINRLLELRQQEASLLGYQNFAEVSLVPKMADSPTQVIEFLRDLSSKAKPFAQNDMEELLHFASSQLGLQNPKPWDLSYIAEKLREQKYAYSEEEVKKYFTEPQVFNGLFKLVEKLFSIQIEESRAPVWHKDVKFFSVRKNGEEIAGFYTDLYARPGKRGGAWMNDQRSRRLTANGIQTPIAYLVCNFASPIGDKPALLTHRDVETLFHEFGHGLHHMLTTQTDLAVSGISGVEWDAVELPSQFMENFTWNWDVIQTLSSHVTTHEKMPRSLFDKVVSAKNFEAGMGTVRQIEFALFDMLLHTNFDPKEDNFHNLLKQVRNEVAVVFPPDYNRFAESFAHIFAGGYAAGYYSYKWAELLSADVFSLFEEKGIFNEEVGKKYLDEILSRGGSRPAMENFIAFRGRKPTTEALLRQYGMQKN